MPWDGSVSTYVVDDDVKVQCYKPTTCKTVYVSGFIEYEGKIKVRSINGAYQNEVGQQLNGRDVFKRLSENGDAENVDDMHLYYANGKWRFHTTLGSNSYVAHLGFSPFWHPADVSLYALWLFRHTDQASPNVFVDAWTDSSTDDVVISCEKPDATTRAATTTTTTTPRTNHHRHD